MMRFGSTICAAVGTCGGSNAMHPINFYLSGVISADFPGEASKYIEELFDGRTAAVFSQGASGDQNPRLGYSQSFNVRAQNLDQVQTVGPVPTRREDQTAQGFNAAAAGSSRQAIPPEKMEAYRKALARTGAYAVMLGQMIATTAVRLMREEIRPVDSGAIWGGQERFSCPGRERLDAANPARENVFPGYKDGAEINFKVGLLRIGDINLVSLNGEAYSQDRAEAQGVGPGQQDHRGDAGQRGRQFRLHLLR